MHSLSILLIPSFLFVGAYASTCPDGATADDLGACLEPVHEVLQRIRSRKPVIKQALLPLLFFTYAELSFLCDAYQRSRTGCPFDYVRCSSSNETLRTIQTNAVHFCSSISQPRQACIQQTLTDNRRCIKSLVRTSDEGRHGGQNDCDSLYEFYACFAGPLQTRCGTSVIADLVKTASSYGCSMDRLSESTKVSEAECAPEDAETIAECFTTLKRFWMTLRVKNPDYNSIGFPLYHFSGYDLERMCDMVNQVKETCLTVQRCPSQPIVQFTNALLGFACGHQRDSFFKHYQCIRESVHDQPTCTEHILGAWEPGYHREVCPHMPDFLRCLIPSVASRCGGEAITVLAQSIRQYWCDIGPILDLTALIRANGVDMDERLAVLALSPPTQQERKPALPARPPEVPVHPRPSVPLSKFPVTIRSSVEAVPTEPMPSIVEMDQEQGCTVNKRNQVRVCLEPVFSKMLDLHSVRKLENYSFPLYHYGKREILELCDLYATSFLQCPFSMFQECGRDYVVTAANALLGYFCSPQHITTFHDHYDCISLVVRNRHECSKHIVGAPLIRALTTVDQQQDGPTIDCRRIERFHACAKQPVDRSCPQTAVVIFKQSLQQFGCDIE